MISIASVSLTGCSYEMGYDLLSQSSANNSSTIRLYGVLHVTNNYVSWSSGSASVHTSGLQAIGTYYGRGDHTIITRNFTFTHDSNGEFKNVGIGGSLRTTFVSGDVYGTMTLPKINRYPILNSGTNFNDEENPVYNITAYNTFPIRVKLEAGGNPQLIIRDLDTKGSINYTLELTSEERNTLRALCPNSNTLNVTETVCAMNGNTELSASFKSYKMTIVNGNPVFSDYTIADINPTTVALTGSTTNNVINVNGYSNIQATITTNDIAEAIKSASMVKYRFKIGDSSTDIAYSSEEVVNGTINNASTGIYEMYAIDSRNNSTLITKQATDIINYEKITLDKQNCSFVRDNNQVGENAILTLNGTFWNDDFGQVNNSIKSVQYRLKKSDSSTWITGTTTITPTISGSSFTFTGMIASDNLDTTWDLDSSYNLEVIVSDELSNASVELILNSAVPTMSLDKNGVGIMCAYDSDIGGLLQVGGRRIDNYISKYTITESTNKFIIDNLNIGENDILRITVIPATSSSTTNYQLGVQINDITSYSYVVTRVVGAGSATSQTTIPVEGAYLVTNNSSMLDIADTAFDYAKGNAEFYIQNGNLCYTFTQYRTKSGSQRFLVGGRATNASISSINKISFKLSNDSNLPIGTKIILEVI